MNTKELIANAALELMNREGLPNVTLRNVAESISKSYGNVTYHFPNKEALVTYLYEQMVAELKALGQSFDANNLLKSILEAPAQTWDLSLKYLFMYKDYVEIRRSFKNLSKLIDKDNQIRMHVYLELLKLLRQKNCIRKETSDQDLMDLMRLSGIVRTMFFIELPDGKGKMNVLKNEYIRQVNAVLKPYLTDKFLKLYF